MLQKGRGEQPIKYKEEVQKEFPDARWYSVTFHGRTEGIIISNLYGKLSNRFRVAWQAWESAYWQLKNPKTYDD